MDLAEPDRCQFRYSALASSNRTLNFRPAQGTFRHRVRGKRRVGPIVMTNRYCMLFALLVAIIVIPLTATGLKSSGPPTPKEYVDHVGNGATIVRPGGLKLDSRRVICGRRPTVLDNNLDDYGAAYPGFLILNPRLLARVPTAVKLWIHAHECGHQFRGPDEETADCFAVQRGRREGWLTPEGLNQVCRFIAPAKADSMHFSGANRCDYMRKCYADKKVW